MRQFIKQKEESVGGRRKKGKDVLGNSMVESARQLSGLGKSRKRTQPKKPPTLSQDEDDRGRKNIQGRGGEGSTEEKATAATEQQGELTKLAKRLVQGGKEEAETPEQRRPRDSRERKHSNSPSRQRSRSNQTSDRAQRQRRKSPHSKSASRSRKRRRSRTRRRSRSRSRGTRSRRYHRSRSERRNNGGRAKRRRVRSYSRRARSYSPSQRRRWTSKTTRTRRRPSPSRSARRRSQVAGRQESWRGRTRRRTPYTHRSPERRTWSERTYSTRTTGERKEEKGGTGLTAAIQESIKKLEARLDSRLNAMGPQLRPALTLAEGGSLQRQDFVAAAVRLPDGDPWKEKFLKELRINPREEETPRQWIHKANTENFRKWLQAPEGSAPFDFGKIFKSLGYSIDVSQRDLPPAVPSMLIAMVLAEAQSKEEINRAAK